jgi:gluconokinase
VPEQASIRRDPDATAAAIVVMGVAGSGKSLVGRALATRLGWSFIEGDELHPVENVARMAAGQPLTDQDRQGWLDAIGASIAAAVAEGAGAVAACSALKRTYRERLRSWCSGIVFVHLVIDETTARSRVGARKGHFMPASLVDSQFATLERPSTDEAAFILDGTLPVEEIVKRVVERLSKRSAL